MTKRLEIGDRVRLIGTEPVRHEHIRDGGLGVWDPAVSDEGRVSRIDRFGTWDRVEVQPDGCGDVVYVMDSDVERIEEDE